jgi:hypothetical protein
VSRRTRAANEATLPGRNDYDLASARSDIVHWFGVVLVSAGVLHDVGGVLDYFEKPWKWNREYNLWHQVGEPTEDNPDSWDAFCLKAAQL